MCRKTRYRDRIGALMALSRTRTRRKPGTRAERRAYRCPKCKGWHLTSNR